MLICVCTDNIRYCTKRVDCNKFRLASFRTEHSILEEWRWSFYSFRLPLNSWSIAIECQWNWIISSVPDNEWRFPIYPFRRRAPLIHKVNHFVHTHAHEMVHRSHRTQPYFGFIGITCTLAIIHDVFCTDYVYIYFKMLEVKYFQRNKLEADHAYQMWCMVSAETLFILY